MSQTLTPPITGTLYTLPSELLFLITDYLTHREYITLWLVHPRLYQVLTSLRPLQLRLKENDPDITATEHMRVLRHLAYHRYFQICDSQAHPIDHKLVGVSASDSFTTDLYHRVWKKDERVMCGDVPIRAQEIHWFYQYSDLFITDDGAIFDGKKLHDAKIARVFKICDGGVFYQDTAGRYILWFHDGIFSVIESPYLRDVKEIHCSSFYTYNQAFQPIAYPRVEYIVYNNGEIYKASQGSLAVEKLQMVKVKLTPSKMDIRSLGRREISKKELLTPIPVRKMCYRGEKEGNIILSFDGTIIQLHQHEPPHYVTERFCQGSVSSDFMLINVTDVCQYQDNMYYLVEGRKVFCKGYDRIFRLIYTNPSPCRRIRVFHSNRRVILRLGD